MKHLVDLVKFKIISWHLSSAS